jgi:hypothetical protein
MSTTFSAAAVACFRMIPAKYLPLLARAEEHYLW